MSQIKIVKGNDAPIQWRVSYQGQPLDLTGKAVTLYVINSRGPFQLKSFEVEGNVVTATYYGADQTRFGEHSLVLRLNEGAPEMSTVAVKEAFELVEWSKDQGGESGEPIKVTPIILEADFAIAPKVDVDPSNYYTKDEANAAFQPKGNYLPREEFEERIEGYATHDRVQKLSENVTELSSQVSGISKRVDELEQGGQGGASTPSGEPMHYMFEAVGATYNATDADIPMVGIYGDSYVHKAHHWHLNELGDLTNDDMREIYAERYPTKTMRYMQEWFREASARTTLSSLTQVSSTQGNNIGYKAQCETILFTADINGEIMLANLSDGFYQAKNLRKILGILNMSSATAIGATSCLCSNLEYVRFKGVKVSANLSLAPKLSNASILYMIENATATGITITLHADAYDRAMADSAITTAMESKQVNLAKA